MKPVLVIGLGNPLMGDDGVGCCVAERLAADPRLPGGVEVICGGTDLFRHTDDIGGRQRVVLVDAVQDGAEPGSVSVIEDGVDDRQEHAHHLSVTQSVMLLRIVMPGPLFLLLGVSIASAAAGTGLSPAVASRIPAILDRVLEELT